MVAMAHRTLKKLSSGALPVVVLAVLLLTTLTLMGDATEDSARFGELYSVLLILNALGLATLLALIVWNLVKLLAQVRRRVPGARLTVRMVTMFVVLAVTRRSSCVCASGSSKPSSLLPMSARSVKTRSRSHWTTRASSAALPSSR